MNCKLKDDYFEYSAPIYETETQVICNITARKP